jgi:hypothetical protein
VSFQRVKTWKASHDPDYATNKARVEHLYAIADGEVIAEEDEATTRLMGRGVAPKAQLSASR